MSYDIRLFLSSPGEDPLVTARRDEEDFQRAFSAEGRARVDLAVSALQDLNPRLQINEGKGFVQAHDPNDGTGILIELNDSSGAITVPYWHEDDAAKVLASVGQYLRVLHQSAGFSAYDPQSEVVLDPVNGFGPSAC